MITFGAGAAGNDGTFIVDDNKDERECRYRADSLTFGRYLNAFAIDLGADTDADTLILLNEVYNTQIRNWDQGVDTADVLNAAVWAVISDDGFDTTLSDGTSDLTFIAITGLTDASDFLIWSAGVVWSG